MQLVLETDILLDGGLDNLINRPRVILNPGPMSPLLAVYTIVDSMPLIEPQLKEERAAHTAAKISKY